jgi:hypothetical protein
LWSATLLAQIALAPMEFLGVRVGKERKKTRERVGSEEGRKLVFLTISLADESASLLMNRLLGIWESLVTPRMTYQRDH